MIASATCAAIENIFKRPPAAGQPPAALCSAMERAEKPEETREDLLSLDDGASLMNRALFMETIDGDMRQIAFEVMRNEKSELILRVNGVAYKSADKVPCLNVNIAGVIDRVTFKKHPPGTIGWDTVVLTSDLCGEIRITVMETSRILSALSKKRMHMHVSDATYIPSAAAENARKVGGIFSSKDPFAAPFDISFEPANAQNIAQTVAR